ncbi:hypothetical protein BJ508DRAFT_313287 [Ascobolus immersus RN42]|uniref:Ty3 transposon capsid-like protein domain-containing protein n=1 Tax=Ascobolus immersus RN42 TaxID=1160509 RepID=A0A3N4HJ94_ASCIM|nr:hypothetical protein BJ508DRAFT_313287 [Ascobolus immersus RN42]
MTDGDGDTTKPLTGPGSFPASVTNTPTSVPLERSTSVPAKLEKETPLKLNTTHPRGGSSRLSPNEPRSPISPNHPLVDKGKRPARQEPYSLVLETSRLPRSAIPAPRNTRDADRGLLTAIAPSNEALHQSLLAAVIADNQVAESVGSTGISIVDALNRRLDEIREWSQHCQYTVKLLAHQLEHEKRLHAAAKQDLATQTTAHDDDTSDDDAQRLTAPPLVRIQPETPPPGAIPLPASGASTAAPTHYVVMQPQAAANPLIGDIPKTLDIPLKANPVPTYNGSSDPDLIFRFLRALEHHIRLLSHFTDLQKINYTKSYFAGSVATWGDDWQIRRPIGSWQRFLREFKAEWLPPTAAYYHGNKLQTMTLKSASQIDNFNYDFQSILAMLDVKDLTLITEGHPYFSLYVSKIQNPSIQLAIQQMAYQNLSSLHPKPVNLHEVMRYTARLFAARVLQSTSSATSKSGQRNPTSSNRNRPSTQPALRAIDLSEQEESDFEGTTQELHATNAIRHQAPAYVRRCHLCMAINHLMRECPLKPSLDVLRRRQSDKTDKKEDKSAGKA